MVLVYETVGNAEHGAEVGAHILLGQKSERWPTAILAISDRLALGVLRAAGQLGLHVPEDLSIVGFDDIPQAREVGTGLTTIRQPSRAKGRLAAQLLLDGRTAEDGDHPAAGRTRLPWLDQAGLSRLGSRTYGGERRTG
jgi:DNA-binding LacI/PurR family transcriptional regulator